MRRLRKTIGRVWIACLLSTASCATAPAPSSDASVQCTAECVLVTKALVKEHADLFQEAIRLRAALASCRTQP